MLADELGLLKKSYNSVIDAMYIEIASKIY